MSGQWRGRCYNLGFRATEHLALQAHRESEKLLSSSVRGNEPPLA